MGVITSYTAGCISHRSPTLLTSSAEKPTSTTTQVSTCPPQLPQQRTQTTQKRRRVAPETLFPHTGQRSRRCLTLTLQRHPVLALISVGNVPSTISLTLLNIVEALELNPLKNARHFSKKLGYVLDVVLRISPKIVKSRFSVRSATVTGT